jgi:hypothetical protein
MKILKAAIQLLTILILTISCSSKAQNDWLILKDSDLSEGTFHQNHFEIFSKYTSGYNLDVLKGIDKVQSSAMDGGGYFVGIKADPPEAPIGYDLKLFGKDLFDLERTTSYCSGASYSAFIEGLNSIYSDSNKILNDAIFESIRMQEVDGSRREDGIKFWGKWNDDGYGNHFALVQYSGIGNVIEPKNAQPGDFMNISWKSGAGHSVVFLGWHIDKNDSLNIVYWSSQKGTNGLGDDVVPVSKIKEVMIVRLTNPDMLYNLEVDKPVDRNVSGYKINYPD